MTFKEFWTKDLIDIHESWIIAVSDVIIALGVLLLTIFVVRVVYNKLEKSLFQHIKSKSDQKNLHFYLRLFIWGLGIVYIFKALHFPFEVLDKSLGISTDSPLTISKLMMAIFVIFVTTFISWFTRRAFLIPFFKKRNLDIGRRYAVSQFVMYIIYTLGALAALNYLFNDLSILFGASAALLVGVGLGLQQTFNDLVSGLILLVEGTVEVGDTLIIDNQPATVQKIGLRTSTLRDPDNTFIIIPNSKLVVDKVINWSHDDNISRFSIDLNLGYEVDVDQIKQIWKDICASQEMLSKTKEPQVDLIEFGDYALKFRFHFYCFKFEAIEGMKSLLRYALLEKLRADSIEIPIPIQRIKVDDSKKL